MDDSDGALVARGLAGDGAAIEVLIARHRPQAVRLAARLLDDAAEAEDAAQEASLAAFRNLARLRQPERFAAWWFATVLNLGRMRLRARRPTVPLDTAAADHWRTGTEGTRASGPEALAEARELSARVSDAIAELPPAQRAAVRGFYWEGLSLVEISAQAGVPVGTIKARLSRARDRLRGVLAGEVEVAAGASDTGVSGPEEIQMLSITVQDVLGWMLPGNMDFAAVDPTRRVVLLAAGDPERVVPIWLGGFEGDGIACALLGKEFKRPMTYEFIARLLSAAGAVVQHAAVTRLEDDTFYATVWMRAPDGEVHEIDARPSDALALALRVGAPIFMDAAVMEAAGVPPASAAADCPKFPDSPYPDPDGGAWRSTLELTRARER